MTRQVGRVGEALARRRRQINLSLRIIGSQACDRCMRWAATRGACLILAGLMAGCVPTDSSLAPVERTFGRRGLADGRFQKPRALCIDDEDRVYVVDMTARIQLFDSKGDFLRSWRTPAWKRGKPTGLSMSRDGCLMVADTHYHRILFYCPDGQLLPERTIGGTYGQTPGTFGLVTDVVEDKYGHFYISEYGEFDRIQKVNAAGETLMQWGGHGSRPGEFLRPQALALDEDSLLWVADACNHRIQVFDARKSEPVLVRVWGKEGTAPGAMRYPYGLALTAAGTVLVSEFGNSRVQEFTREGVYLRHWGRGGREVGAFHSPWAIALDSSGRILALDTYNHRVQVWKPPARGE